MLDNGLIMQATDLLDESDFYVPAHRRIFGAMIRLIQRGAAINPILIGEELKKDNALTAVGGFTFISGLTDGVPHSTNLKQYAKVVKGKSQLRSLIHAANSITQAALEQEDEPEVILNHAQQAIFTLGHNSQERRVLSLREVGENAIKVLEALGRGDNSSIASPWTSLNNLCRGGIQASELWGIAALIKQGKSAVMKQWAQMLGAQGRRVLIFTREMSEIKILFRMLAAMTGIPASHIRFGLDESRIHQLIKTVRQVQDYPIFIDAATSKVDDFRARVREMIRLEGIEIVFGDYLQLFHSGKKSASRADEVGYVWRTMKETAQDFDTRVVALAQFNREAFREKRPYFHQVEGSGEGEKAVDVGMVLCTDLAGGSFNARPATIYVDYQRDEAAGTECHLNFDGRSLEFFENGNRPPLDFNAE